MICEILSLTQILTKKRSSKSSRILLYSIDLEGIQFELTLGCLIIFDVQFSMRKSNRQSIFFVELQKIYTGERVCERGVL